MGLPCLNPVGTHAHELSMVTSALYPHIDQNKYSLPLTQIIGHYLYYELVWKKTGGASPMLPDTLGTRAFMKAANLIKINVPVKAADGSVVKNADGSIVIEPKKYIDVVQLARQDSGKLPDFKQNMIEFGYFTPEGASKVVGGMPNSMMASEIDTTDSLLQAFKNGYNSFGAGGFFGDSIKVWGNPNEKSNSMAVKAVRVVYEDNTERDYSSIVYIRKNGNTITGYPIKIGDPDTLLEPTVKEGKLSLDKNLTSAELAGVKGYAARVRAAAVNPALIDSTGAPAPADGIHIDTIFNIEHGIIEEGIASLRGGRIGGNSILNWLFN
jgi:hypothetical protein